MVKVWLEATTWMEFPYNAYEHKHRCVVPLLNKQKKKFDLKGFHLGDKAQRRDLFVECKRYTSAGAQYTGYGGESGQRLPACFNSGLASGAESAGEFRQHRSIGLRARRFCAFERSWRTRRTRSPQAARQTEARSANDASPDAP